MSYPFGVTHPAGEELSDKIEVLPEAVEVDTFAGKVHVEWDQNAAVTPLGQFPFFIRFLK